MSFTWVATIIAVAAVSVWLVEISYQSSPRYRNVVQVFIVMAALLFLILGFLNGIQQHAFSE